MCKDGWVGVYCRAGVGGEGGCRSGGGGERTYVTPITSPQGVAYEHSVTTSHRAFVDADKRVSS